MNRIRVPQPHKPLIKFPDRNAVGLTSSSLQHQQTNASSFPNTPLTSTTMSGPLPARFKRSPVPKEAFEIIELGGAV